MQIDNFAGDSEDAGAVLRPSLIAVVLVSLGIALWGWQDRVDSTQPQRISHLAGQIR